jgi:uncharacterized protein involved in exopolysaccharide biosynthesis
MDQAQSIGDLLALLRRRWLVIAALGGLGTGAAVVYALNRPSVYETSAKVLIESQQIPDELARSTVTLSTAARLQLIEQRLMARDSLAALIERLGLFADLPQLPMTRKVGLLRDSTRIDSITASGNPWDNDGGVVAFTITVTLGDAGQAALVANELAESAIAQNLEVRSARAGETLAYFEEEERRIAEALAGAEAEISAFKKANEGALPEDLAPGREALARLQTAGIELDRQLLELDLRRSELEAALAGGASVAGAGPSVGQSELERLELELATRRRVLAPNHPELRRLQEELEAVRALLAAGGPAAEAGVDGAVADRAAAIRQQRDQIAAQIARTQVRRRALEEERQRLEAAVIRNPEVEASLHALERELEQLHERYADVARRRAEARTGARLEANRQSERFEILEPALVPDDPVGPNRKKIVVFGAAASGGLALGAMLVLEMVRPSMRTSAQMVRQLEIRPVVAIPYVAAPGETRRRVAAWIGAVVLVAGGLWFAAPLIDRHVVPLAPLRGRIEQRLDVGGLFDRFAAGERAPPGAAP